MNRADLRAALSWKPSALLRSSTPGARAFYDVLHLRWHDSVTQPTKTDPLSRAAYGLWLELSGRAAEAKELYGILAGDKDQLVSLLGLALMAWTEDANEEKLRMAGDATGLVEDKLLRAQVYCKLLGFALDRGFTEESRLFFRAAMRDAEDRPRLLSALDWVGHSYLGEPLVLSTKRPKPRRDDWVDAPWIEGLAANAARKALTEFVTGTARSPWSRRLRFGSTEVDEIAAAELQATWAGTVWLLPRIRLQLGAQLLAGGAETADQYGTGVAMWILGGGGDVPDMIRAAEREFDHSTADSLLTRHLVRGRRAAARERYAEAALATWDLVSDQTARLLFEDVSLPAEDSPLLNTRRQLWGRLALRAPEEWSSRFMQLPTDVKKSLLASIPVEAVRRLPAQTRRELLGLTEQEIAAQQEHPQTYLLYAELAADSVAPASETVLSHAPAAALALLALTGSSMVREDLVQRAADELLAECRSTVEEGRRGLMSMGLYDPIRLLGVALGASESPSPDGVRFLVDVGTTASIPNDLQFRALMALLQYTSRHSLPDDALDALSALPAEPGISFFEGVSRDLLRAVQMAILSTSPAYPGSTLELIGLARHPDARIREMAVRGAARATEAGDPRVFDAVILAGLYDPQPDVLRQALIALRVQEQIDNVLLPSVASRLVDLLTSSWRDVREEVARTAAQLRPASRDPRQLDRVVRQALADRSWLVREVAAGSIEPIAESG